METLREVAPNLWVSGLAEAELLADDVDVVIDCTTSDRPRSAKVMNLHPTGRTNHSWTAYDLEDLVGWVSLFLEEGQTVLIHCNRGRSRSATAAAAVLLDMGLVSTYEEAIERVSLPGFTPTTVCLGGLRSWLRSRA